MSTLQSYLGGCPTEILFMVSKYIDEITDISALSSVCRRFHWLFGDRVFRLGIEAISRKKQRSRQLTLTDLFLHAVRHDSINIITYLTLRSDEELDFRGVIPRRIFQKLKITFIHHALVADAPRVAAHLAKHGADIIQEGSQLYPDLTPLGLTLARPSLVTSARELDIALRIACSFALSRTTRMLLIRGVETNELNKYGAAPIHVALAQRAPWFPSIEGHEKVFSKFFGHSSWESMVAKTMDALVEFGADPNRKSETSRAHRCGHRCWKSLDCDHKCQAPMHLAAASGNNEAIRRLLNLGADPIAQNGEGYTPLYAAISHGHLATAKLLLSLYPCNTDCDDCRNPIVHEPSRTTALHVACRFAFLDLVDVLLKRDPDPNVVNHCGNTPIHEVLGQTNPELRDDVVGSLMALARAGADASTPAAGKCPYKTARSHVFPEVRDMFVELRRTLIGTLEAIDEVYRREGRDIRKVKPRPNQPRPSSPEWTYEFYTQQAPDELDAEKHFPTPGGGRSSKAMVGVRAPGGGRLPKPKMGILIDISTDEPTTRNSARSDATFSGSETTSTNTPWAEMKKKEGDWVALEPSRKHQPGRDTRKAATANVPPLGPNWSGPLAPKVPRAMAAPPAASRRAVALPKNGSSAAPAFPSLGSGGKSRNGNVAGTGGGVKNSAWVGGKPNEAARPADKPQIETESKKSGRGKKQWNRLEL
ncbi:hypothetical protein GGTG_02673 [Gaeumannomyces tritici R3-111a-1]|uniref:Ankyrin n=1 Tax=Gaeumannomyces tritici (strain R3-111a-1) TaxID=644352 RepID=J3NN15_GAET3|nr:hypothetical protein GGTG_02673 [Gaeumannomyces tritici R3-111a-1]EJT77567.1 hypothetical protein GGTG_02673 [Gaeumannomyces tritici R3-111a-1]